MAPPFAHQHGRRDPAAEHLPQRHELALLAPHKLQPLAHDRRRGVALADGDAQRVAQNGAREVLDLNDVSIHLWV